MWGAHVLADLEGRATAAGTGGMIAAINPARWTTRYRSSMFGVGVGDTVTRGDEPGEMGDALPVIDLGF